MSYALNYIVEKTEDGLNWWQAQDPNCIEVEGLNCNAEFINEQKAVDCALTIMNSDHVSCRVVYKPDMKILHHFVNTRMIDTVHPPIWLMRLIEDKIIEMFSSL